LTSQLKMDYTRATPRMASHAQSAPALTLRSSQSSSIFGGTTPNRYSAPTPGGAESLTNSQSQSSNSIFADVLTTSYSLFRDSFRYP
jgi:hypothetical protein